MSGNARHKLLAAALCAVALVAAGCGGSTEYSDKYADAKKDFQKSSQAAAAKLRASKSAGQYLKAASQFEGTINALILRLEKLKPPGDVKKAHERLILVLKDFASYVACQERVSQLWRDPEKWSRMSILNSAGMGKFSSDRCALEYAREIWNVVPTPITVG
jgi:starch phosphorylase